MEPNGSAKKYENALDWLIDAGMIRKVLNVSTPQLPLAGYELPDQFKIYATDIGLATAMFGFQTQIALIEDTLSGPAKGGIYENLIFDILVKKGYRLNYIKKPDSTQEIEFLLEQNRAVIPVEVKSKKGETASLNQYLRDWAPSYCYKLTGGNLGEKENKWTLPHYLAIFI